MTGWRGTAVTDGTAQQDRFSPALEPGYFDVDEFSFAELLALGADLASVINFFNLGNEADGTWRELFHADETVIMAMILSTNLQRIEAEFSHIAANDLYGRSDYLVGVARKVDFWFNRLNASRHRSGAALAQKLAAVIEEKLAVELHNTAAIMSHVQQDRDREAEMNTGLFASIWRLDTSLTGKPLAMATIGEFDDASSLRQSLRSSFNAFFNAISYLKSITPPYMLESLGSQQHDPAVGLFIVFLKLYEKAQQKLNTFTRRHLDFYYYDVLKTRKRGQVPECLYLLIETLAGTAKARIAKDTAFTPGKDAALNEIIYTATDDLIVTDAEVSSLATLSLQHDSLIFPESALGYATRMKAGHPPSAGADGGQEQASQISWPLFGGRMPGTQDISMDADIGFAVASRLLLLQEGVRKIELAVELARADSVDVDTLVSALLKSQSDAEFTRLFAGLFAIYLFSGSDCLSLQQKNLLIAQAEQILAKTVAAEIDSLLTQDRQGLFYKLFRKMFSLKLTAENGWLDVDNFIVVPYREDGGNGKAGLRIQLILDQDVEPVTAYVADVHAAGLQTELPVLQCHINPHSHFFAYSVFQQLVISALHLRVDVRGIRNVLAYNQHGQLDPSTPFQPFGPLPGENAYFIFGNHEIAGKRLQGLDLNLEWAGMPRDPGGFDEYYRGYEIPYSNRIFKGEFCALLDGGWQPYDRAARPRVELFASEGFGSRLLAKNTLAVDVLAYAKADDAHIAEETFEYNLKCRNGFFRLSLAAPATAFGHAEYPEILSRVLSANARLKKPRQPPNPPYTPILNRMSLDYRAGATITPGVVHGEGRRRAEQLFHLHPFGVETVYPTSQDRPCFLLPQYSHAGNLFIGLSASNLSGSLTLFFSLTTEVVQQQLTERLSVDWFYLSSNIWKPMPANRVLSDTTNGFLNSGVVRLNIPEDIDRDNSVMPGEYYWLRAAAQKASSLCRAYSVQTNAVKVVRQTDAASAGAGKPPEAVKWATVSAVPGIGSIRQVGKAFGGRSAESAGAFKMRVSERLRHKNRALAPWDYERLILQQFPDIYKVKCFSAVSAAAESSKPGNVLIVVVPDAGTEQDDTCARMAVSPERLDQVRSFVDDIAPPFASIEVGNPVYEQVQVRCSVKFADGASNGININALNKDISRYICPWNKGGYKARFGWSIRQKDIESYVRSLKYVDFVTNFSMLHITRDREARYRLFDTATDRTEREVAIRPRYPWSLALPVRRHFIETIETIRPIKAEITGIDELEVGSTFIVSGNRGYGEEE